MPAEKILSNERRETKGDSNNEHRDRAMGGHLMPRR